MSDSKPGVPTTMRSGVSAARCVWSPKPSSSASLVNSATASESVPMWATSRACSLAFTGTAHRPATQQANSASMNSRRFSINTITRSPAFRPSVPRRLPAIRVMRSPSCAKLRLPRASVIAGSSGEMRARFNRPWAMFIAAARLRP